MQSFRPTDVTEPPTVHFNSVRHFMNLFAAQHSKYRTLMTQLDGATLNIHLDELAVHLLRERADLVILQCEALFESVCQYLGFGELCWRELLVTKPKLSADCWMMHLVIYTVEVLRSPKQDGLPDAYCRKYDKRDEPLFTMRTFIPTYRAMVAPRPR